MNTEDIIKILIKIRAQLAVYCNKNNIQFNSNKYKTSLNINIEFPILELLPDVELYQCSIHGVTYMNVKQWIVHKPGIKIALTDSIEIEKMYICIKDNTQTILPIQAIIHTFIHELAHTVTTPELMASKNISKKRKKIQPTVSNEKNNTFMQNHHSDLFYVNFAKLLRISEILNIYILPKTHRVFTIKNLQRYDSLINPNDLMSLGTSPLFKLPNK